ncbi:hypothetical protein PR202_gb28858 [Eleusine coracana subsp. coracana]|uniref:Phytocyanin domain-containing protein n=1 Tax=Eleusine coracana subsp. coracana TaxID=191504 RepID=A0AAV5FXG8_ELECO|nr:hypothetical protein PR202_gb28858 [Eleusine coracana subsp. coracana]
MASTSTALVLFVAVAIAAVFRTAHGASYTVGAPAGSWDLRTNYANWVSGITFRAGDVLVFKYARGTHDVLEVSKADYDSCSGSSPIASFQAGDDRVPLPAGDVTRYFICGVPGHCDGGMKLAVRVEAAAAPSPVPVTMPPPRAAVPSAALPPSSNSAASAGSVASLVGLGLAAVMAGLMGF